MTEPEGLLPSLPEALAAISGERDRQLQHFEGLDTKAGVLLGFDGVLVALARNAAFVPRLIGVLLAAASAVLAMLTFRPRRFPTLDPQALRRLPRRRHTADPARAVRRDNPGNRGSQPGAAGQGPTLRWSLWALLAAVLIFGVAVILPPGGRP